MNVVLSVYIRDVINGVSYADTRSDMNKNGNN